MEIQKTLNNQTNLERGKQAEVIKFLDFKLYHNGTVIKPVSFCPPSKKEKEKKKGKKKKNPYISGIAPKLNRREFPSWCSGNEYNWEP